MAQVLLPYGFTLFSNINQSCIVGSRFTTLWIYTILKPVIESNLP